MVVIKRQKGRDIGTTDLQVHTQKIQRYRENDYSKFFFPKRPFPSVSHLDASVRVTVERHFGPRLPLRCQAGRRLRCEVAGGGVDCVAVGPEAQQGAGRGGGVGEPAAGHAHLRREIVDILKKERGMYSTSATPRV